MVIQDLLRTIFSGAIALSNAHFGQGSDDIVMDDVACSGSESKLTYCSYSSSHNCVHQEDASVQCQQNIVGYGCALANSYIKKLLSAHLLCQTNL